MSKILCPRVTQSRIWNAGSAAVEFAITAPLLVLLALGAADYGAVTAQSSSLAAYARAGAEYARSQVASGNGLPSTSTIQSVLNLPSSVSASFSATDPYCTCADGTSVTCPSQSSTNPCLIDGVVCKGGKKGGCSGGNLTITGLTSGASITGPGVTIVLTDVNGSSGGSIDIDPGATCNATPAVVSLTAPGPGAGLLNASATASQGLLIFQDPTAVTGSTPSTTITTGKTSTTCNSATVTLSGAIVTPASDITLQGNPVTAVQGCTEFIAQSFLFGGTPQLDD